MAQAPPRDAPLYEVGQTLWFADGRSGAVARFQYNPIAGQWTYYLDPLGGMWFETDLLPSAPEPATEPATEPTPEPPPPGPTGPTEAWVRDFVASQLGQLASDAVGIRAVLTGRLRAEIAERLAELANTIAGSQSAIVTQLSEIQDRVDALDLEPHQKLKDIIEEWLVREMRRGLSR